MNIKPYAPRPVHFLHVLEHGEWRFKIYALAYQDTDVAYDLFTDGMRLAMDELPDPAIAPGRPGVGFMIAHQGKDSDYLIMAWWDRENELPLRVFLHDHESEWRKAQGSESVCVWELPVIAHERDSYVKNVMTENSDINAYLRDTL